MQRFSNLHTPPEGVKNKKVGFNNHQGQYHGDAATKFSIESRVGMSITRDGFYWSDFEKEPHVYKTDENYENWVKLAKENGFEHVIVNKTVGAYGAWIACDFDPESADVIGSIAIKVEGEIESGINEVLNKVAQSGKIYNAAGQLVGKGNINTVNSLPAGIYVVNGVKVIKK
jgi:hypothetical protein